MIHKTTKQIKPIKLVPKGADDILMQNAREQIAKFAVWRGIKEAC